HRTLRESNSSVGMCYGFTILINYEDNRQALVQKFARAFGGILLHRFEDFLKRNHGHDCPDDFFSAHNGRGNRERHFLTRSNYLWPAHDDTAAAHMRQHVADSLVDLFAFDHINLESAMDFTF